MKNLKLEELSIEQKIGMLLCARSFKEDDPEDLEFTLELIRNHALGCVQGPLDKPEIVQKVKEAADYPILIVADMEMGFKHSQLPPVSQATLAACNDPKYYRAFTRAIVSDAKKAGFNSVWSPVLDILDGDGPCRVHRRLSDDPRNVALAAEEMCRVFAENSFLSCGKHYPGGERGGMDTHMSNDACYATKEELLNSALVPYLHLMKKGLLPAIMSGHSVCANIDPDNPACLSKKVIDIIREQGFDGVCYTDSLGMMAILQMYGEEELLGKAVAAGNDIVLPPHTLNNRGYYELLLKNYRDGLFSEERLNEAARRVLAAQALVGAEPTCSEPFTQEDRDNYLDIARACVTAVTDPGVETALSANDTERLFIIVDNSAGEERAVSKETLTREWYDPDAIEQKIHKEFPKAEVVHLPEFPQPRDNLRVLQAATKHHEVVVVTFCNTKPFMGTDCLTRRVEAVVNALVNSGKVSAVVHCGNPHALKNIKHVPRRLFGFTMPEANLCAIEALAGKLPAEGKLPFHIEFD